MNSKRFLRFGVISFFWLIPVWIGGAANGGDADQAEASLAAGKEIFTREWLQDDWRSFAGSGLGPVFNARSCVACHKQGGVGGSGPAESNVTVVTAFVDLSSPRVITGAMMMHPSENSPVKQPNRELLAEVHPALRKESSFPLHRFGADLAFQDWKVKYQLEDGPTMWGFNQLRIDGVRIALIPSARNTPALFGAGLIDRIPDSILEREAVEQAEKMAHVSGPDKNGANAKSADREISRNRRRSFPIMELPVSGRLARLQDGKIGRFGWKGNVATLRDFTLQACSNELGLEVPGFQRAAPPWIKDYKSPGPDLSAEQCNSLVQFLASLPRPISRKPETPELKEKIAAGEKLFGTLGCALCHRPKLGDVDGLYSDLLLHDMGQSLSGSGFYGTNIEFVQTKGGTDPLPINRDEEEKPKREKPPKFGAGAREWRTPPLWGVHDSAPYLHDGRAKTIAEAILAHNGEGAAAMLAFEKLPDAERKQVEEFLHSLTAPGASQR
jgi:CxxC motif-containing protein (DUF1111 family)